MERMESGGLNVGESGISNAKCLFELIRHGCPKRQYAASYE